MAIFSVNQAADFQDPAHGLLSVNGDNVSATAKLLILNGNNVAPTLMNPSDFIDTYRGLGSISTGASLPSSSESKEGDSFIFTSGHLEGQLHTKGETAWSYAVQAYIPVTNTIPVEGSDRVNSVVASLGVGQAYYVEHLSGNTVSKYRILQSGTVEGPLASPRSVLINASLGSGGTGYFEFWIGTQAEYDALTPNAATIYLIQ